MKETPQVRKSLHKPYRYDNTNRCNRGDMSLFLLMIFIALITIFGFLVIYLTIHLSLYILGISVVVMIVAFKIYNTFYHRYYRILKITEQQGKNENRIYYAVQSCISYKKLEKIVHKGNATWRNVKSFYNDSGKKEAEAFFDRKTIENKGSDIVISQIRKSIHKPRFSDKFFEKNNFHVSTLIVPGILLGIVLIIISLRLLILFIPSNMFLFGYLAMYGIIIFCTIVVYQLYIRKNHRYIRLIESTVWQGRYKETSYHLQSFISKKKLEKIERKKDIKWKYYEHHEFKPNISRKSAEYYFDKDTIEKKVIEEVL
ncbi:hypothetical protein Q4Q35_02550 [Flavivirga aquimarina]|uniref:Uncharacterized protein n=1 Tax=Flavivirga aquimarina TaxID=2027862 RepID=A0ABT8W6G0_9FLAO|nr:hypothetical protein [Flavivirga aquimarina]MDO5968677.1 hypothetical protein [Flavivirga aquimarina]